MTCTRCRTTSGSAPWTSLGDQDLGEVQADPVDAIVNARWSFAADPSPSGGWLLSTYDRLRTAGVLPVWRSTTAPRPPSTTRTPTASAWNTRPRTSPRPRRPRTTSAAPPIGTDIDPGYLLGRLRSGASPADLLEPGAGTHPGTKPRANKRSGVHSRVGQMVGAPGMRGGRDHARRSGRGDPVGRRARPPPRQHGSRLRLTATLTQRIDPAAVLPGVSRPPWRRDSPRQRSDLSGMPAP